MLTERQELILSKVVDGYLRAGQPVGSKSLAADAELSWGSSTIRNELAALEEQGLLGHPHTSAGRVPTDAGYRHFVDGLLAAGGARPPATLPLRLVRRELDEAMRTTTEALSHVNDLLAIVSAPPIETATIRHVEVLALQPQVLMVVVITSTGSVTKRIFPFEAPIDPGLADWAASYLNERVVGMGLGARMLAGRLEDPALGARERDFVATMLPAFTELEERAEESVYVGGAARLLEGGRFEDVSQLNALMELLERRRALLGVLRETLTEPELYVRIGAENRAPALRAASVVAAGYGLPQRMLGAVSVIGPVRMDYAKAIGTVRDAAQRLSRYVEDLYEER